MLARPRARGLVDPEARLTATGRSAAARIADARRDEVQSIVEDWKPEEQPGEEPDRDLRGLAQLRPPCSRRGRPGRLGPLTSDTQPEVT